jgi:predicted MPP superfamily phosphohydrolase
MANTVTWLHLSDLHASKRTDWDSAKVRTKLREDLEYMQKEHKLRPDLIFFTGDAAYGQIPGESLIDQYQEAQKFFEEVRKTFTPEVPQPCFFIVPGNHDVNRNSVSLGDTLLLESQKDLDLVNSLIQGVRMEWKSMMNRLAEYRAFLDGSGYRHLLQDEDRLLYAVPCPVRDVIVRVVGLNSAWSCHRENEKGQLWMAGKWQLAHAREQKTEALFSILLSHHPLNWFVQYEDVQGLRNEIQTDFDFYLHGHEHEGWVDRADRHTRIAAGACYETSESSKNGYNFVRLDLDTQKGKIWLRQYDSVGGGWVPRVIHGKTDDRGIFLLNKLNLPQSALLGEKTPKKLTPSLSEQQFDIKTTVLKTMITEEFTEILKLRTIRAREEIRQLIIEPQPNVEPYQTKVRRKAQVSSFFALPGRASKTPDYGGMFQVDLAEDEVLVADEDHAILLGYTMDEPIENLFDPPGIVAQQPVGTDALFIEVYFPPGWNFDMVSEVPGYRLYSKDGSTKEETILASSDSNVHQSSDVSVKWLTHDFGAGPINFFRVKIVKPTQDGEINFDWKWKEPIKDPRED